MPMQAEATLERPKARAPLKGGVVPYLMLDGAADAIEFYKRAFGAEEVGDRAAMPDGRLMNARIDVNGGPIIVIDPIPGHGHPGAPHASFNLHLHVDDPDRWFHRAVAAGRT